MAIAGAIAAAAIAGTASALGTGIKAGVDDQANRRNNATNAGMQVIDIGWQKQRQQIQIANDQNLQSKELQNRLDVTNVSGLTNRDVANIAGQWASVNNERTTSTQLALQKREFDQSNYLRTNLVKQLAAAGLPEYLAYIQPDESMMQTRRVGGHNVTVYKGSNMRLYGVGGRPQF